MSWLQLSIAVDQRNAVAMEELLLASGALSVTLQDSADQAILEPGVGETPLWRQVKVTALYEAEPNLPGQTEALSPEQCQRICDSLYAATREAGLTQLADSPQALAEQSDFELLPDKHWERAWLDHFQPIHCGGRLWICPSWATPPDENAVNLLIDPGLAFGTGTHETTLLCLQWLSRCSELQNSRILDFGCGSGILGIASLLLGADHCCFVDNDPQALTATEANLQKNCIAADRYSLFHADDYSPGTVQFDHVLANILAGPLIELAPLLVNSAGIGGSIVLSGLQTRQRQAVQAAYDTRVEFSSPAEQNDWLRLNGKRLR